MPTKIIKNLGCIFKDNYCQLGCQLMSIRETSFVWVGRATRRWQPKTKGIWWVKISTNYKQLNQNYPKLLASDVFMLERIIL